METAEWAPPPGLYGRALKRAYRMVTDGTVPDNWRSRPTIIVPITRRKTMDDNKMLSLDELEQLVTAEPAKPVIIERQLPRQVEVTCDTFEKQFHKTSDRCTAVADALQEIVDNLRKYASYCELNSTELPASMREAVQNERDYDNYAALYESLVDLK